MNRSAPTADAGDTARLEAAIARGGAPGQWLRLARLHARAGAHHRALTLLRQAIAHFPARHDLAAELLYREADGLQHARAPMAERMALRDRILAEPLAEYGATEALRAAAALIELPDLAAARALLEATLPRVRTTRQIAVALRLIPIVIERAGRTAGWLQLLETVRAAVPDDEAGALELSLLFALERREEYLARFDAIGAFDARHPLAIIARRWRTPLAELLAEPRVIGIGLPKTATTSLAAALSQLGLFHADHHSPVTHQYVTLDDAIFYDSVTDCGAALNFEAAHHLFPNARFILTDRPRDDWIRSLADHFHRIAGAPDFDALRTGATASEYTLRHGLAQRLTHYATLLNAPDAAAAHARHDARVTHFFADKPGKLLRFNVFAGDGWRELCAFLGRAAPAVPFPRENVASEKI